MSALILDDDHIDFLVSAVVEYSVRRGDDVAARTWTELGRLMLRENYRSVDYRYKDSGSPGWPDGELGLWESYRYRSVEPAQLDPVQTIKVVQCYQYQSCEHPGWGDSEAKRVTDRLLDRAIERLSGMNEAAWVWRRPAPAASPANPAGRVAAALPDPELTGEVVSVIRAIREVAGLPANHPERHRVMEWKRDVLARAEAFQETLGTTTPPIHRAAEPPPAHTL